MVFGCVKLQSLLCPEGVRANLAAERLLLLLLVLPRLLVVCLEVLGQLQGADEPLGALRADMRVDLGTVVHLGHMALQEKFCAKTLGAVRAGKGLDLLVHLLHMRLQFGRIPESLFALLAGEGPLVEVDGPDVGQQVRLLGEPPSALLAPKLLGSSLVILVPVLPVLVLLFWTFHF